VLAAAVSAATAALLAYASVGVVQVNRENGRVLAGGLPEWVSECVMPLAFGLMALRFAGGASPRPGLRLLALLTVPAAFALGLVPEAGAPPVWPLAVTIPAPLLLGAPRFLALR